MLNPFYENSLKRDVNLAECFLLNCRDYNRNTAHRKSNVLRKILFKRGPALLRDCLRLHLLCMYTAGSGGGGEGRRSALFSDPRLFTKNVFTFTGGYITLTLK